MCKQNILYTYSFSKPIQGNGFFYAWTRSRNLSDAIHEPFNVCLSPTSNGTCIKHQHHKCQVKQPNMHILHIYILIWSHIHQLCIAIIIMSISRIAQQKKKRNKNRIQKVKIWWLCDQMSEWTMNVAEEWSAEQTPIIYKKTINCHSPVITQFKWNLLAAWLAGT